MAFSAPWAAAAALMVMSGAAAQRMPIPLPPPPPPSSPRSPAPAIPVRADAPPPGIVVVSAIHQEVEGKKYRLRGQARIETAETLLRAEEIDWDEETGLAEARGSVEFTNFTDGSKLWASRADYDLNKQTGAFYKVKGSTPGKFDARPGVLTTGNPFLFEGDWAEKFKNRYVLYQGTLTNCTYPKPWWTLQAPKFDIVPNDRALAYRAIFRMKGVPILYSPAIYKSLAENPRRSGFLTPNFGTSNSRGVMYGLGYYWAINRSYDLMYRSQYFTQRGFAHTADFRGKPTNTSDFDVYVYGVDDRGERLPDGNRFKAAGYIVRASGQVEWGKGWYSKALVNYLSSYRFRRTFTESFNEAVGTEVNSVFFTSKNWSTYHFNGVFTRQENFYSDEPENKIAIRRFPTVEFNSREKELLRPGGGLPLWVSWSSSAGLVRRTQPLFQTRRSVERLDIEPRLMTALRWKDFHLLPYVSLRETYYGSSFAGNAVVGDNLNRLTREFGAELILPTATRVFETPSWLGSKLKHAIEPRVLFRSVAGVDDFRKVIRFDEMDIVSNTTEVEFLVANRFWSKRKDGEVFDFLNWEISHRRFFDPDFGGAVVSGQRNVVQSTTQMTGYTFLDQPRRYSPIVSMLRANPRPAFGLEWRADYDPFRGRLVNTSITADARLGDLYFFSLGHNRVACVPLQPVLDGRPDPCIGTPQEGTVLTPPSNQLRAMVGLGSDMRRGWNAGFFMTYDYRTQLMTLASSQLTYNTSCCAYSFQYRRFSFAERNENQFRVAFVIANIGSFGTLRRQDRLF